MNILNLIEVTAGGRHGWYATDQGFRVRKPLGAVGQSREAAAQPLRTIAPVPTPSLWRRVWTWLVRLFARQVVEKPN